MTKIGSLNIEGRESRRFRQVNCDIERSVATQCDWGCICSGGGGGGGRVTEGIPMVTNNAVLQIKTASASLYLLRGVTEGISIVTNNAVLQINTASASKENHLPSLRLNMVTKRSYKPVWSSTSWRIIILYHTVMITIIPPMSIKMSKHITCN